jgi:ESCRT-I complex subunit VPS37
MSSSGLFPRPTSDVHVYRMRSIETLRQYFPACKEVAQSSVFDVLFQSDRGIHFTLRVMLSPNFPMDPPQLQLYPHGPHGALTNTGLVTPAAHAQLEPRQWSMHANLGKVVYEVTRHFAASPPLLSNSQNQTSQTGQNVQQNSSFSAASATSTSTTTATRTAGGLELPPLPDEFEELRGKNDAELGELLRDEQLFDAFFETLECVKTMRTIRADLVRGNEELARDNLKHEQQLSAMHEQLKAKEAEVQAKSAEYDAKLAEQRDIMQRFTPASLIDRLSDAIADADHISEQTAQQFIDGELELRAFTRDYLEQRKVYHRRNAKREALSHRQHH